MIQLMKNEYIKLFKKPKNIMVIILFLIMIIGIVIVGFIDEWNTKKNSDIQMKIEDYKELIQKEKLEIKSLEEEFKIKSDSEKVKLKEIKSHLEENIKSFEDEIADLNEILKHPVKWRKTLEQYIEKDKKRIEEGKKELGKSPGVAEEISSMEDYVKINEYYLENNIEPVYEWEMYPVFTLINLNRLFVILIPIFIVLMGSDIVSDEWTNETFKFLLIQPERRSKILAGKFLTLLSIMLITILGVQLIVFLGIGVMRGFPDLEMLIRIGMKYEPNSEQLIREGYGALRLIVGSGEITTYGTLLVQSLILQSIYVVGCCFVVFMFSTIFKNNLVSLIAGTIVVMGGAIIPMIGDGVNGIMHLTFFIYGWSVDIIKGDMQWSMSNPHILASVGATVIIITSIIAYSIANMKFKKTDVLG